MLILLESIPGDDHDPGMAQPTYACNPVVDFAEIAVIGNQDQAQLAGTGYDTKIRLLLSLPLAVRIGEQDVLIGSQRGDKHVDAGIQVQTGHITMTDWVAEHLFELIVCSSPINGVQLPLPCAIYPVLIIPNSVQVLSICNERRCLTRL